MAAGDCAFCEAMGFRTCDGCGGLVDDGYRDDLGRDLCEDCRHPAVGG